VALLLVAATIGILIGAALKTVAEEYQDLRWVSHEVMIAGLMVLALAALPMVACSRPLGLQEGFE
jgi:uncharacterized membrane protein YraQ (UPF0718 family)